MAKAKSKKECVYMPGMSEALKKGIIAKAMKDTDTR